MKTNTSTPHRLFAYGSLALGSTTILATQADAATIVDVNSNIYDTGFTGIGTVQLLTYSNDRDGKTYVTSQVQFTVGANMTQEGFFKRGADDTPVSFFGPTTELWYAGTEYAFPDGLQQVAHNGALLGSNDNWFYAVAPSDSTQRLWLQFDFGINDGEFSIVKAVIPGEGETINNAAAAAAAVPEPSAIVLLALGATGLMVRRRRQAA